MLDRIPRMSMTSPQEPHGQMELRHRQRKCPIAGAESQRGVARLPGPGVRRVKLGKYEDTLANLCLLLRRKFLHLRFRPASPPLDAA